MTTLRTDIEKALSELISNEEGMRFQGLAVVLAKQRWPELIASERHKDLGLDAYVPASLAHDGIGKGLLSSLTATLEKIKKDIEKFLPHVNDVKTLLFTTPCQVTNHTENKWADDVQKTYGIKLIVLPREDIITDLMLPSNASICRTHLRIDVPVEATVADLLEKGRKAAVEVVSAWLAHPRLIGRPKISLEAVKLDQGGKDTNEVLDLAGLQTALLESRRIVMEAPGGRGKTTTLVQLAERHCNQGELAFLVDFPAWVRSRVDPLEFISSLPPFRSRGINAQDLARLYQAVHFSFLLNGWNEVSDTNSEDAVRGLAHLERSFPTAGIIIATRTHHIRPPLPGSFRAKLLPLSRAQRTEYLRQSLGSRANELGTQLDANRDLDDLTRTPLILAEVTTIFLSGALIPKTKAGVLGAVMTLLEQSDEHCPYLEREPLAGRARNYLTELAVRMTAQGDVTIEDACARSAVYSASQTLSACGQIATSPEPASILSTLCAHHVLERLDYPSVRFRFQHQQFQEWYASFEVEALMLATAAGDREAKQKLRADVINMPTWEEPILFACERVSRANGTGLQAVAKSVVEAIGIDPIFAAEMIYRSSDSVWNEIKEKIIAFIGRWHVNGKVDRAVQFMISTGRSEFAPQIWPLILNPDSQVHLAALRAGRRFRLSVLGPHADERIARLPEEVREHVISGIVMESDMDGIELATRLARADASPKVQFSAIEALLFRRADRYVTDILRAAPDEVWRQLARKGYADEITDLDAAARLRQERLRYIEEETDPLRKLRVLLDAARQGVALGQQIGSVIEEPDFPTKEQDARWIINDAHKSHPTDVATALLHRLEAGREIPFRTEDLIRAAGITVDEGPFVDLVMQPKSQQKVAEAAVSIIGPKSVGKLIDSLIVVSRKLETSHGRTNEATFEEIHYLKRLITRTPLGPFVEALLSRSSTVDPGEITLLADLLGRHGKGDEEGPLQLDAELYKQMIAAVGSWAETLLESPSATRDQLADVAGAIERLAAPELVSALQRMLEEDLKRWQRAREEHANALKKGIRIESDAHVSWTLQYRRAFSAIGDSQVVELMKQYLPGAGFFGFGCDAAHVLKDIYQRGENLPRDKHFVFRSYFSEVKARRVDRQDESAARESSSFSDEIFAVISDLVKPDAGEQAHRHAMELGNIALSMPYGDRTEVVNALLQLPLPLSEKQGLFRALVLAGEIISAEMVLDGIKALLEEAKIKQWLLNENQGRLDGWLELLPFSDRPEATIDALDLLEPKLRQPWRLGRLLSALGHAPSLAAEHVLDILAQKDARFLSERDWLSALDNRSTVSAVRILLKLIGKGAFDSRAGGTDTWTLSLKLAAAMRAHPELRAEVYQQFEHVPAVTGKAILEHAIAEAADAHGVLILARSHVVQGKPFDSILYSAIRHVVVGERPSAHWVGTQEVFSLPCPELRKRLFSMINGDTAESKLAEACLTAIDELRDDYGPVESEPRHPDIDSGRPWPLAGQPEL